MDDDYLGFNVGDTVECRSFGRGYRGAWFRCTIVNLTEKKGRAAFRVKYLDLTDEKRLYVHLVYAMPKIGEKMKLMVRPEYPPFCPNGGAVQMPVVTVLRRDFEAGDRVDWYENGCFWGCKILAVVNDKYVRVLVPDPPYGEGGVYNVEKDKLRPALKWSRKLGWSVEKPKHKPLAVVRYRDRDSERDAMLTDTEGDSSSADRNRNGASDKFTVRRDGLRALTTYHWTTLDVKMKLARKAVLRAKITSLALKGGFVPVFIARGLQQRLLERGR